MNAAYLDDVTVGHQDPKQVWVDTLDAVAHLAIKGLPLGAGKCVPGAQSYGFGGRAVPQ